MEKQLEQGLSKLKANKEKNKNALSATEQPKDYPKESGCVKNAIKNLLQIPII